MSYSAAVIGLGKIGQGYDYKYDDDSLVLTHASGYLNHDSFRLVGAVDIDNNRRQEFEKKYRKSAFYSVAELMNETKPDVVSIAVSTQYHFDVFNEVMAYLPRAVVCEKPIAESLNEAEQMVEISNHKNCSLLVNYIRRFEPGINELREKINSGYFGKIYKGTVLYSKGLLNNGSHLIDLLMYLFDKASNISILNKGRLWGNSDPEPDFSIQFGELNIVFLAGREECFEISELELLGTKGKIKYSRGGKRIEYELTKQDPIYSGYTILDDENRKIQTDINRYQYHVFDQLAKHLNNKLPLKSDGVTATETLRIIEEIKALL